MIAVWVFYSVVYLKEKLLERDLEFTLKTVVKYTSLNVEKQIIFKGVHFLMEDWKNSTHIQNRYAPNRLSRDVKFLFIVNCLRSISGLLESSTNIRVDRFNRFSSVCSSCILLMMPKNLSNFNSTELLILNFSKFILSWNKYFYFFLNWAMFNFF